MAANVMEILKQIRRDLADQKEFMRIKFNLMEGKIYELDKKIDQQQDTIEKLEQQVKKNNVILLGNEETEIESEDTNTMFDNPNFENKEMEGHLLEQSEKDFEHTEVNQVHSALKVTEGDKKECSTKDENDKNACIEYREHSNINKITDEDKMELSYDGDNDKEDSKKVEYGEFLANEIQEIKDIIKDYIATRKASVEDAALMCKQVTATQTDFTEDKISELNERLEKIKHYNIGGPIDSLRQGVVYYKHGALSYQSATNPAHARYHSEYKIKLGMLGFKRLELLNMLTENPTFSLHDVVKEGLRSTNEWNDLSQVYDFERPNGKRYGY